MAAVSNVRLCQIATSTSSRRALESPDPPPGALPPGPPLHARHTSPLPLLQTTSDDPDFMPLARITLILRVSLLRSYKNKWWRSCEETRASSLLLWLSSRWRRKKTDFIALQLLPPNSSDLNLADDSMSGILAIHVVCTKHTSLDLTQL